MKGLDPELLPENLELDNVTMFLLFSKQWLEGVMLVDTNKHFEVKLCLEELLRFLGMWIFMATLSGYSRNEFFSCGLITVKAKVPYRLTPWMLWKRFEAIHAALRYTTA